MTTEGRDFLATAREQSLQSQIDRMNGELADAKRETANQRSVNRRHVADLEDLRKKLDLVTAIDSARLVPPRWLTPPRPRKGHTGTVCLLLTDTHFGEVVNPLEVEGLNAFDDTIAELRMRQFAHKSIGLARDYVSGIDYDGCVLFVGGDIFTGTIHDELLETNSETLYASVVRWLDPLAATIYALADAFGKVHVAVTYGNHGRRTKKPRAKQRAQDNIEWLMYKVLERETRADKRITWQIPDSADTRVTIANTRYLLTHGDQFRGGSGISGALAPLMLGQHRKTRRASSSGLPFDEMVIGHFHHHMRIPGLIMGGTIKGTDEYSYIGNFGHEEASQTFWVNTPQRGPMFVEKVAVVNREAEGW